MRHNSNFSVMRSIAQARGLDLNKMVRIVPTASQMQANKVVKPLADTEMHQTFVVNANSKGFTFGDDDRPERIVKAFFAATAAYLSKAKVAKIDEAAAIVLTDVAGVFKFAGIVEYHENEANPDEPGNWSLVFTFNESDLADVEKTKVVHKNTYSCSEFKALFDKIAYDVAAIEFMHDSFMFDACLLVIDSIINILDCEAVANDTVDIEFEEFFVASVAVEDGEKVFGIVPGSFMKEIIKDDSALSKD